jgi:hypothetical protein
MLRIPHCLDSRVTDGRKVVSLTHRPRSTPQKHYFSASDTHFCYRLSEPQGLVRPEGFRKSEKNTLHRVSNPRPYSVRLQSTNVTAVNILALGEGTRS